MDWIDPAAEIGTAEDVVAVDEAVARALYKFYVYMLFDFLGIPRYVGKGEGDRWEDHERGNDNNDMKNEFIKETKERLGEIPKIKIWENLSNEEAFIREVILIKIIGRYPNGPLTNMTDGGEGCRGFKPSVETIAKISQALSLAWADPVRRERWCDSLVASWADPDKRSNRIVAIKEAMVDPICRKKISDGRSAFFADPDNRE